VDFQKLELFCSRV